MEGCFFDGDIGIASGASNYAIQMIGQSIFLAESNGHINLLPGINPSYAAFAYADTQVRRISPA